MDEGKLFKSLEGIKSLLVLQLLISKVPAKLIAKVLNIDSGNFSRLFPVREIISTLKKKDKNKRNLEEDKNG